MIFDLPDARITTNGTGDHSITLDKFQSYIIANTNSTYSLIGSLISSDKPIVVNIWSFWNLLIVSSGGQDYGMDQIVDASLVGSEYIFIEGIADKEIETVLIVADQDNTTVNVNGAFHDNLVNAGDFLIIKGDKFNMMETFRLILTILMTSFLLFKELEETIFLVEVCIKVQTKECFCATIKLCNKRTM